MSHLFNTAIRAIFTFVALSVIVFVIPWYLLAIAAIGGGFFMLKTGEDRALSQGILIGGLVFALVFFLRGQFPGLF